MFIEIAAVGASIPAVSILVKRARMRKRIVAHAARFVGIKERPTNRQQFGEWYGLNGVPWCAIFLSRVLVLAGSKAALRGHRWSYVPELLREARERTGRRLRVIRFRRNVKPGDLACMDWGHDGTADHIGIVTSKIFDGRFNTIEGNTSMANDSNGGEVMRRNRHVNDVAAFIRVLK